jgi:hypothetical protein
MKSIINIAATFAATMLFLGILLGTGTRTPWALAGLAAIVIGSSIVGAVQDRDFRLVSVEAIVGVGLGFALTMWLFPVD